MIKKLFLNDKFILILILINAITLFISGYELTQTNQFLVLLVDNVITLFFIVEIIVKMNEYSVKGYFKSNWNIFDFVLVIISIPALLAFVLNAEFVNVSYLLVFRILRVFKSFRFFKFIPKIGELVRGVQEALKASVFILLGFVVFIFVVGILSHYIFIENPSTYFDEPLKSMYSLFRMFTLEGWTAIPNDLSQYYGETKAFFTYLYFVIIVMVGGVFGMSLVTSIFVDAMVSDNNDEVKAKVDSLENKVDRVLEELKKRGS